MSQLGFFNIGDYIGDPRLRSSPADSYPALDKLRDDLGDLAEDILTPPEKLEIVDLLQDRLEIHKKLRSIINNYLNFQYMN